MGENIKNEFKEFISTLSSEICKEVLLEDLKTIKSSLKNTGEDYKNLCDNYKSNIKNIREQLLKLEYSNTKLDYFIKNVDENNNKLDKGLNVINGGYREAIGKVIADNLKLFNQYSENIQRLNAEQRNLFIRELNLALGEHTSKYINQLESIINSNDFNNMFNNINKILNKADCIELRIKDLGNSIESFELNMSGEFENRISEIQGLIKINSEQINYSCNNINEKLEDIARKNKIIIILSVIILIICISLRS